MGCGPSTPSDDDGAAYHAEEVTVYDAGGASDVFKEHGDEGEGGPGQALNFGTRGEKSIQNPAYEAGDNEQEADAAVHVKSVSVETEQKEGVFDDFGTFGGFEDPP